MEYKDANQPIAIDTETTSLNPSKAELVGLGFCFGESLQDIVYIPIGHQKKEGDLIKTNQVNQLNKLNQLFINRHLFKTKTLPKCQ